MTKKAPSLPIIPLNQKITGPALTQIFQDVCLVDWHPVKQKRPFLQNLAISMIESYCKETPPHHPLRTALKWIALAAEQSPKAPRNAYHNPSHTAQVAMMTGYFCAQAKVSETDFLKGLCAAFGHDIGHPGKGNPAEDVTLNERQAAKVTTDIMMYYGVDDDDIADVNVMILSTSPNGPHEYVTDIAAANRKNTLPKTPPVLREQLRLIENPQLVQLCAILCDADIFLSAGTNKRLADFGGRRLNQEARKAGQIIDLNTPQSRLYFLDHIVGKSGFSSDIARELANNNYKQIRRSALQAVKK